MYLIGLKNTTHQKNSKNAVHFFPIVAAQIFSEVHAT